MGDLAPDESQADPVEARRAAQEASARSWRRGQLERMGFEGVFLELLTDSPLVWLHEVEALLLRGCPHDYAARILL